jgi:hypothetical protein
MIAIAGIAASGFATVSPSIKKGGVVIGKKHRVKTQKKSTAPILFSDA